jgi:hypothetical protein
MGYTVCGEGTLTVKEGQDAAGLAALKAWAEGVDHVGYAHDPSLQAATSIREFFAELLHVYDADDDRSFSVSSDDSWSEDFDAAAHVVAPFIEAGCTAEWQGEEGEHWRWRFDGTQCHEEFARLVYGDE